MRISQTLKAALLTAPLWINAQGHAADAQPLNMKDEATRINYSLGYQIGGDFKRQGVKMDAQAVIKGIEDALSGGQPQLSQPEMLSVLRELKNKIVSQQRAIQREMEVQNLAQDKKFMEENKDNDGIKTTASGLQYKIVESGKGKSPKATDTVTVNYRGTLINNQEFDSSFERGAPASFALNSVIKGWTEGLQLIKEGGKIQLFIPPELAYNDRGPLANRSLIFEVELLSIAEAKADLAQADAQVKE